MMGKNTASSLFEKEDAYADVVDNCFVDIAVRTGTGFVLGGLTTLLFLKGRRWPLTLGSGLGFGSSLSACQNTLQNVSHTPPVVAVPVPAFVDGDELAKSQGLDLEAYDVVSHQPAVNLETVKDLANNIEPSVEDIPSDD